MLVVTASALRARLGEYLAAVKRGEDVIVTMRGKRVARLTGERELEGADWQALAEMAREGLVTLPRKRLTPDFWRRPRPSIPGALLLEAILAARHEARQGPGTHPLGPG